MDVNVPIFQFEIRFNPILNFGQISKKLLVPYVKFTTSIKIDNPNSLNEATILNFEEEDYLISISWDRIFIRGQGKIKYFTEKNSVLESILFDIMDKIKELDEFESIKNVLLLITYLDERKEKSSDIIKFFNDNFLNLKATSLLPDCNDVALVLENNQFDSNTSITFGPYFGIPDLKKRPLPPVNLNNLNNFSFNGIMMEYKKVIKTNNFKFSEFVELQKESFKKFESLCKV